MFPQFLLNSFDFLQSVTHGYRLSQNFPLYTGSFSCIIISFILSSFPSFSFFSVIRTFIMSLFRCTAKSMLDVSGESVTTFFHVI